MQKYVIICKNCLPHRSLKGLAEAKSHFCALLNFSSNICDTKIKYILRGDVTSAVNQIKINHTFCTYM